MVARVGSLLFLVSLTALAQGRTAEPPVLNALRLQEYSVMVSADEEMSKVVVEETFYNPGSALPEAVFLFPLAAGAAPSGIELKMNGRYYGGNLLDQEKADRIYTRITRRRRDPALIDCVGKNLYRCRVFPIWARSPVSVRFAYTRPLQAESGMRRLVVPLDAARFNRSPAERFRLLVNISTKRTLQAVLCPTHAVKIERPSSREAVIELEAKNAFLAGDLVVLYSVTEAPLGAVAASYRDRRGRGYFVLSVDAAFAREQQRKAPRDVVVAVDTSNSTGRNGVDAAAAAVADALTDLVPGKDRYALMAFGTEPRILADYRPVGGEMQADIRSLFSGEPVAGRTSLGEAIEGASAVAGKGRPGTGIILLTDGVETEGGTDALSLVRLAVDRGSRVGFCGVGNNVDTVRLDSLGARGEGDSAYAVRSRGLTGSVRRLLDTTRAVPLTDVSASVEGASRVYPRRLRMLRAGESLLLVGRYEGHGERKVGIRAKVAGERVERTISVRMRRRGGDPAVARMWAARHVGRLLAEAREKGEPDLHRDEIRTLGRRFGIVTPHTSLLVLEEGDQKSFLKGMRRQPLMSTIGGGTIGQRATITAEVAAEAEVAERIKALRQCRSGAVDPFEDLLGANRLRVRRAAGRTFYRGEDGTWRESALVDEPTTEATEITFLSEEWSRLKESDPDLAPILALGTNVLFTNADGIAVRVKEK